MARLYRTIIYILWNQDVMRLYEKFKGQNNIMDTKNLVMLII